MLDVILGGSLSIIGAVIAIRMQFRNEREKKKEEYERSKKIAIRKIADFLSIEIFKNMDYAFDVDMKKYIESDHHADFTYDKEKFTTKEYDALKEDIFRYEDPFIDDVIHIYHIFNLLKRENNLKLFRQREMNRMRNLFKLYEKTIVQSDELLRENERFIK